MFMAGWLFPAAGGPTDWAAATLIGILGLVVWAAVRRRAARKRHAAAVPANASPKSSPVGCEALVRAIAQLNGKAGPCLFAANRVSDLPVTVPVGVAVELAQTRTCLLIDLDIRRNAVATVFDLDTTLEPHLQVRAMATGVENLSVWPSRNFQLLKQMNLKQLIENASKTYASVLIYAPCLTTLPDRRQVAACCKYAIASPGTHDRQLMALLKAGDCTVLKKL